MITMTKSKYLTQNGQKILILLVLIFESAITNVLQQYKKHCSCVRLHTPTQV